MVVEQNENTAKIPKTDDTLTPQPEMTAAEDSSKAKSSPSENVADKKPSTGGELSESGDGNGNVQRSTSRPESRPGAFAINNPLSGDPIVEQLQNQSSDTQTAADVALVAPPTSFEPEKLAARPIQVVVATPVDLEANGSKCDSNTSIKKRLPNDQRKGLIAAGLVVLVGLIVVLSIVLSKLKAPVEIKGNNVALFRRREDMIEFLGHFEPEVFDPTHPNASADRISALKWIVEDDPMQLPIPGQSEIDTDDASVVKLRQRFGLALFYFATNGDEWEDDYNFLSELDICKWSTSYGQKEGTMYGGDQLVIKGILCDDEGKINKISMWWNNLAGTMPDELPFFLDTVIDINLSGGSISGTIPSSLGKLSQLEELSFFENCLTGNIPEEIISLPLLSGLYVGGNNDQLSGNLAVFCDTEDPLRVREGKGTIAKDVSIDCSCCLECYPDEFRCWNPLYNASWLNVYVDKPSAFDSNNNAKQFQKECTTPVQLQWVEKECPCAINVSTDPYVAFAGQCSNCTAPDAWPTTNN